MEKITIIHGPARSGKSRLAKDIAESKNTLWISGRSYFKSRSNFRLQELTEETELIVIDDIPEKSILQAMAEFSGRTIMYFKKGNPSFFDIPKPKMIFIVDSDKFKFSEGSSITARFDFIRLDSITDYFKEYERIFGHLHPELTEPG
jgi:AAA+ ATPase superfamily predicted ATPase